MTKITVKKEKNPYLIMDKTGLQDKGLSWKAKGILAYLLSLPDDWQIYLSEITNHSSDGIDKTKTGVRELMSRGYITRSQIKNEKMQFVGYEYFIYENPKTENPITENPITENPITENPTLLNNNNNNNKYNNNNNTKERENKNFGQPMDDHLSPEGSLATVPNLSNDVLSINSEQKKEKSSAKKEKFKKPTVQDVKDYCNERKNKIDAEGFIDFYESKGWKVGGQQMKDWQACIRTWERRDRDNPKQTNGKPLASNHHTPQTYDFTSFKT